MPILAKDSAFAFIFSLKVKRINNYISNEIIITEIDKKHFGFLLRFENGEFNYIPITKMSLSLGVTLRINDISKVLYSTLNPKESIIKKMYFRKSNSLLNLLTKQHNEVDERKYPKIFKNDDYGETTVIMEGGAKIIKLKSDVYGDKDKFYYQFVINITNIDDNNNVHIESITFNKVNGSYDTSQNIESYDTS